MRYSKFLLLTVVGVSVVFLLSGCSNPLDKFFKKEENTEIVTDTVSQSEIASTELSEVTTITDNVSGTAPSITEVTEGDETGGGNPDVYKEIEITVADNQYFYNNHEISFEEICDLLNGIDANTSVIVFDEMASESAYSKITEYLDEHIIPYIMK